MQYEATINVSYKVKYEAMDADDAWSMAVDIIADGEVVSGEAGEPTIKRIVEIA